MKIRVQKEDGTIALLQFDGACLVQNGNELDRLVTAEAEHFFTKDGFYDGWGKQSPC